jgi:hypothetical protein
VANLQLQNCVIPMGCFILGKMPIVTQRAIGRDLLSSVLLHNLVTGCRSCRTVQWFHELATGSNNCVSNLSGCSSQELDLDWR